MRVLTHANLEQVSANDICLGSVLLGRFKVDTIFVYKEEKEK